MKKVLLALYSFAAVASLQAQTAQHFLIRIWPARGAAFVEHPTEAEGKTMGAHAAYIKQLYDQGIVVLAGPSINGEKTFGLVVVRAATQLEARKVLEDDPSYKAGIMKGEVLPFALFVPPSK